jgi:iron complex outermembrane recepter protein
MKASTVTTWGTRQILLAAVLASATSGIAMAQNAAPATAAAPTAADESSAPSLQEIVVTATRREESLSKVPISISAYSQDSLDERGVKDITELVRYMPGVSIDQTGTNAISIRGISSSAGAGTTGIYIDDTPIQMRSVGFNPDDALPKTFDVERVEVLRGPQGTLFGAGSEGGTVRYIMAQPSLTTDSTYARAETSYTQYGAPSYELGAAHGGPIIDGVLGYRASIWYRWDGGWIDRVDPTNGEIVDSNANRENDILARLAFEWKPFDALTVTPSAELQNDRKHDVSTYWPTFTNPSSGAFFDGNPDRTPIPDRFYLLALKIDADLGPARLISNTSYYNRNEYTGYEGTLYNLSYYQSADALSYNAGYPIAFLNPAQYPLIDTSGVHLPAGLTNYRSPASIQNRQISETEELRLVSNDPSSRLTWTVGAFWQGSKETSIEQIYDPMANSLLQSIYGLGVTDIFFDINGNPVPLLPNGDDYYNTNTTHDFQIAGFGEVGYAFTDQWKLTLGGRVARTSFDIVHFTDGPENYGVSGPGSASESETPFTPKVSLNYTPNNDNLFYFTYAKGFRVGGANPPLPSYCAQGLIAEGYASGQAPETYKSDSTQSFEVGAKDNLNNVFRIASSVYYIRWNDIQQSVYVAGACGLQFTDNLGTAVSEGFDLQAEAALGQFALDAAIGYNSARYVKNSPHDIALDGDAISGQAAINGAPGTSPPWNVTLGAQYNIVLADHKSFARLDYEFESRNPWLAAIQDPRSPQYSAFPTPISFTTPSTTFVSFRMGTTLQSVEGSFFIDNLLNSRTLTNYERTFIDSGYTGGAIPGPLYNYYSFRPRTFGLTFTYHH